MKLTDTQLVVLSAASRRPRNLVLPLPELIRGGAAAKVATGLLSGGLIEEVPAGPDEPAWREAEDGERLTLVLTGRPRRARRRGRHGPGAGPQGGSPRRGA